MKVIEPGRIYSTTVYTLDTGYCTNNPAYAGHQNAYPPLVPLAQTGDSGTPEIIINFITGRPEVIPGIIIEDLLDIAIHRLHSVNVGDLKTRETSMAITKLEEARFWLKKRKDDRLKRKVLGTYEP